MTNSRVIHGNNNHSECPYVFREKMAQNFLPMGTQEEPFGASGSPLFLVAVCDSYSVVVFGLFRKLFWFLSPGFFFPTQSLAPPPL
jgi:hypothetical protein